VIPSACCRDKGFCLPAPKLPGEIPDSFLSCDDALSFVYAANTFSPLQFCTLLCDGLLLSDLTSTTHLQHLESSLEFDCFVLHHSIV